MAGAGKDYTMACTPDGREAGRVAAGQITISDLNDGKTPQYAEFSAQLLADIKAPVAASLKADTAFVAATKGDKGAKGDSPYVVEAYADSGNTIKNGQGSTRLHARVLKDGAVVEDSSSAAKKFTYTWTKHDALGKEANWQGASSPRKTGNPVTVAASEINVKATFRCEVTKE